MSVGSIGSTQSFWQQDQNYRDQQQSASSSSTATDSIISAISSAETSQAKGLASIANETALKRVNSQLTAAIQNVLSGGTTSSTSSGSTGSSTSSSASSGSSASSPSPATGTGTAPVTTGTQLSSLGIYAGGGITVSAGGNTTTYVSTGSDTVGDLISAINEDYVGNAAVTASLNKDGDLVITSKNTTDTVVVGGVYAWSLGFGGNNNTFTPTKAASSAAATSATSSSSSTASSSAAASSTSSSTKNSTKSYTTMTSENASSAASLLSDSGVSGSLVDMLT